MASLVPPQGGHHGGKTALLFAAEAGQDAIVRALVAAGAEVNAAEAVRLRIMDSREPTVDTD